MWLTVHAFNEVIDIREAYGSLDWRWRLLEGKEREVFAVRMVSWLCCLDQPREFFSVVAWLPILACNIKPFVPGWVKDLHPRKRYQGKLVTLSELKTTDLPVQGHGIRQCFINLRVWSLKSRDDKFHGDGVLFQHFEQWSITVMVRRVVEASSELCSMATCLVPPVNCWNLDHRSVSYPPNLQT